VDEATSPFLNDGRSLEAVSNVATLSGPKAYPFAWPSQEWVPWAMKGWE